MSNRDGEEPQFVDGGDFNDWLEKNREVIQEMMRNDPYELLYKAWFVGYSNGLERMAELSKPLWTPMSLDTPKTVDDKDETAVN